MSQYNLTVAQLTEILKARNLPHSGKKADLIARLVEDDEKKTQEQPAEEAVAEPVTEPIPTPTQAVTTTEDPSQNISIEPIDETIAPVPLSADSAAAAEAPSPDTTLANQTNYSLQLPSSELSTELAKRKARAERFGTASLSQQQNQEQAVPTSEGETPAAAAVPDSANAEAIRALERAKRFGTAPNTAIAKLDEALPSERAPRGHKRAAAAEATDSSASLDDPGLKRGFLNRNRGAGVGSGSGVGRHNNTSRGGQRGGGGNNNNRRSGPGNGAKPQGVTKAPAYTSEKDKLAAEARKKKFATA